MPLPLLGRSRHPFVTQLYSYQSLGTGQNIRLFKLGDPSIVRDGESYSRPQYSIIETSIQDAPGYETLSYTWGTTRRDKLLELAGQGLLPITKTLQKALPHIARQSITGYIWIDQICINQDDISERAHQVTLMGNIYSQCQCVLVWIGPLSNLTEELASQITRLHRLGSADQPACLACQRKIFGEIECCRPGPKVARALCREIVRCKWFSRGWVFQEVVLPSRSKFILTDNDTSSNFATTISLQNLKQLCTIAWKAWRPKVTLVTTHEREKTINTSQYAIVLGMFNTWKERHQTTRTIPKALDEILSAMAPKANTTNQHDQLYAYFGMNQDSAIKLTPSYQSSFQEALLSTVCSLIKGSKSLDILRFLPRTSTRIMGSQQLPSWVPEFSCQSIMIPFVASASAYWKDNAQPRFYAWHGHCDSMILKTQGVIVDVVSERMGPTYNALAYNRPVLRKAIKSWTSSQTFDENVPLPTMARLLAALLAEGYCEPANYDAAAIAAIADHATLRSSYPRKSSVEAGQDLMQRTSESSLQGYIETLMKGRELWMTEGGRFATGSGLRKGDLICILHGSSHPLALRPAAARYRYSTRGMCYLEGWMDPWTHGKVDWNEDTAREFMLI